MYTRCSECQTLFRVTREQLNAARGQVRCGRCGMTFDALASLREEVALPEEDDARQEARTTFTLAPESETESPLDDEDVDESIVSYADLLAPPPREPVKRWPWVFAVVVCALALAALAIHAQRENLAGHERIGPYISDIYSYFGRPVGLDPEYDLRAFSLLHHELVSHARSGDALHLSGVLYNEANFAQPWPTLELRLEDRFGDIVAARRLEPEEYLRNPPAPGEPMPAGARRAIEIAFVDPGEDAVGFSIDFCLMLRDGMRCSGQADFP